MRFDVHIHDERSERLLRLLEAKLSDVSDKVDALVAEVASQTTVIQGAEALLNNLNTLLQEAIANRGNDPALAARVQAVIDQIDAQKAELAQAITTNTPAATPAPEPTPSTEPTT